MKRLAMTGKGRVEVLEYDERALESGEVRVKTEIASGKHGTSLAILDGVNFSGVRFDQNRRLFLDGNGSPSHLASREKPLNLGTTAVGTITEVAPDVTGLAVGDRVFGLMDIRATNTAAAAELWQLGDLDPLNVLCIEPAYVSFHAIREAGVRIGDKVAVVGLGAIGLIAVAMCRQAGAEQIIAVDPIEPRRTLAKQLGASDVVEPTVAGGGDVAEAIHELTGGPGVDVSIECAGRYDALDSAIRSTRVAGTVSAAGFYQGEASSLWLGREWHHNRLSMIVPHGCGWGHPPRDFPRWDSSRAYDAVVSLMRQERLDVSDIIQPVISIDRGPDVYRMMIEEPQKTVKFAVEF